MSEWWTYRPEDFLMFSLRTYERLFVLHNQALWPLQALALMLGGAMLFALLRPRPWSSRLITALLAVGWGFVAWAFLWQRYVPINWAIRYLVPLFVLQALLLIALGAWKGGLDLPTRWGVRRALGVVLFVHALALHPLMALATGRGLLGAEVIGLTPDPLAIASLGVAALVQPARYGWILLVIPLLWCLVSSATLQLLAAPGAWLPMLAAGLALLARRWPGDSPSA
ncbi:DUF6064 family protein [Halomonas sp. C05BenzN]|uniref:DUF6064 family protein n=1 Tax=Halomonas sp. C05BenzN TaxID=3411041 RepID=UPI003B955B71